ncbi:MAG: RNA polymerase sigma factor, partial [Candidatus Methylomirabilales bacterium]
EQACEMLVRRHGGCLLAVARGLLHREGDAREAVQDAFLGAFLSIRRFEGTLPLSTWLYRIGVNAVLMKLRASPRHPEAPIENLLARFDHQGRHASPVSEWSAGANATLLSRETRGRVRACLDRMPLPYRVVLVLRDIGRVSTGEIAAILGIGEPAVRIRLHRARVALRTLLVPVFGAAEETVPCDQ